MLNQEEKDKLEKLFAAQHVAVLITDGEEWPTATLQAFGETDDLDLIFIMNESAEKYQNLLKRPKATVMVDTRDTGDIPTFRVTRAVVQGVAHDVKRDSGEWNSLKATFLQKNPFEHPFFNAPVLRMMRIKGVRVSYAGDGHDTFKAEF
ncbi:MAG TPA: pyridoxamine 5'-phosphate oxidase family protein [Candidatus Binataceae bacterium]|nr:pyridoxamine 5'-phosphate oxidase family protein [Candidatus Binataceae bacterium]